MKSKLTLTPSNSSYSNKRILHGWMGLLLCAFTFCSSCKGQKTPGNKEVVAQSHTQPSSIGHPVSELAKQTTRIFQASNGEYWFGTRGEGAYLYDGLSLVRFTVKDGLCSNRIRGIQEDKSGNVYFDTGEGINKFDGLTIETLIEVRDSTQQWKMGPNDLWFEGRWNQNGPCRFDGKQLYHLEFPPHALEDELLPQTSFSPYDVYKTEVDSKGNAWMGTSVLGACRYDGESLFWVSEREMTEIDPGPAAGVRSMLEDQDGNFWFSSNVNHKYRILEASGSEQEGRLKYEKLEGIPTSSVPDMPYSFMAMVQDLSGDIWMADYTSEVWRWDGENVIKYEVKDGDISVLIFSIYKDKRGDLWLGTTNAGAMKFDGKAFVRFEPKLEKSGSYRGE